VVAHCLDNLLRMLHPIMPFITEAIWMNLNAIAPVRGLADTQAEPMLISAAWPRADAAAINPPAQKEFDLVRDLVRLIRNARTQHNVTPSKKLVVIAQAAGDSAQTISRNIALMQSQANLEKIEIAESAAAIPPNSAAIVSGDIKLYVLDIIDRSAELTRLTKQADTLRRGISSIEGKLGNAGFVAKAPSAVVEKERQRLEGLKGELAAVESSLKALE
jgi:valyl-tRNA synthetase